MRYKIVSGNYHIVQIISYNKRMFEFAVIDSSQAASLSYAYAKKQLDIMHENAIKHNALPNAPIWDACIEPVVDENLWFRDRVALPGTIDDHYTHTRDVYVHPELAVDFVSVNITLDMINGL